MSYTTPQLDAAGAVADLLTGKEVAGFTLVASADDLLPKYDLSELHTLRIDCVPGPESRLARLDRGMAEEDCPVNVGIQYALDAGDRTGYRRMLTLLRGVARLLMFERPEGFGLPREDVEIVDFPTAVEQDGRFYGIVGVLYRVQTEAGE